MNDPAVLLQPFFFQGYLLICPPDLLQKGPYPVYPTQEQNQGPGNKEVFLFFFYLKAQHDAFVPALSMEELRVKAYFEPFLPISQFGNGG